MSVWFRGRENVYSDMRIIFQRSWVYVRFVFKNVQFSPYFYTSLTLIISILVSICNLPTEFLFYDIPKKLFLHIKISIVAKKSSMHRNILFTKVYIIHFLEIWKKSFFLNISDITQLLRMQTDY